MSNMREINENADREIKRTLKRTGLVLLALWETIAVVITVATGSVTNFFEAQVPLGVLAFGACLWWLSGKVIK